MSKKFSIIKHLDISTLDTEIVRYMDENKEKPYIFINKETIDDLECITSLGSYEKFISCKNKMECGVMAMYRGFKVYENNDLKYGEVELR